MLLVLGVYEARREGGRRASGAETRRRQRDSPRYAL